MIRDELGDAMTGKGMVAIDGSHPLAHNGREYDIALV